jgi:spermidine/putrescine transport system permease protein
VKKNSLGNRLLIALSFLFLYAPIFVLIAFSFNASKSRTVWAGFTLDLQVSLIAAAVATVAGTAAAVGFFSMRRRTRGALLTVNNIPLTNADIITGVSLMLLFVFFGGVFGFERGMGTLLIAHITFDVPYVILSVMPKLRHLDRNLIEAAQDLGATPWQGFWKVVMPELRSGILSGALMAFTMSVDDFVISYFTPGPG